MNKQLQSDIGQQFEEEIPFICYNEPIEDIENYDFEDDVDTEDYYE
jgi:hypothetical protein